MRRRSVWRVWAAALFLTLVATLRGEISPRLYSVELTAQVANSPASITLSWTSDANATSYSVDRKLPSEKAWNRLAILPGSATTYADTSVGSGILYEYQVLKTTTFGYPGSGYIYAGISVPPVENRGKIILLVDDTHSAALQNELALLRQDLIGDGWTVIRRDVPRTATPPNVKALIAAEHAADPQNIRAVFIFGHVAVPYSGDYAPDDHDNHRGAWPADSYYADINGTWTDSSVTRLTAEKSWNHNRPGDGKFDQNVIPSDTELEIGRVDLFNMTCFANKTPSRNERDLLRQYLAKDHAFRHAQFSLPRRGLIVDAFGEQEGEAYAANGWRNFAPFFGPNVNREAPWGTFFSTLANEGYLCAYGTGGGGFYTCAGVGSSDDFALTDIKTVFTFYFGSYFGDWDNESNFLRAPLGTTSYTLVSAWAGRPHWFLHGMAMGETIGHSARLTQNNTLGGLYEPNAFQSRAVHIALMGDPTLRLHPVIPPKNLALSKNTSGVKLTWAASTDTAIAGYYVYRATSLNGPFTRVSGASPVTALTYTDASGVAASAYMVRALKLEATPSGSYYNLSQGVFGSIEATPAAPSNLTATASGSSILLNWKDNSANETEFRIFRKAASESAFTRIATVGASITSYQDAASAGIAYTYRVQAWNSMGESAFSNDATAQVSAGSAVVFVGRDDSTGGTWKGAYGEEGRRIIEDTFAYPPYVSVTATGNNSWIWTWSTADTAALLRTGDSSRLAACWYASASFEIQFTFNDANAHRVSLYFLDWDQANRSQRVDLLDATGAILSTHTVSNFANGAYLTWDLKGTVKVRITALQGNAVVSGIFFDSSLARAQTPVITPAGGTYLDKVDVTIAAEAGAQIRYTLDGSDPVTSSPIYTGPIALTANATVKARAFKTGVRESLVAIAAYKVVSSATPSASVEFAGSNSTLGGTWKGSFGSNGYTLIADATAIPAYAQIATTGAEQWIWQYTTQDPRALQRVNTSSRMAPCWYSGSSFDIDVNITASTPRTVSFYCLDWDYGGRAQTIEVIDFDTGKTLHTTTLNAFTSGIYLRYRIQGRVLVRFTRTAGPNAVVSGVFFDP